MTDIVLANIGKICVVSSEWDGNPSKELALEWVEPSNYCMYADTEYSHTLTLNEARMLIAVSK